MLKKKCSACNKKIGRKFNFCPYCGVCYNESKSEDYGLLGNGDEENFQTPELGLPFGMNKLVNSLVKQLEKQMGEMNFEENEEIKMPRGFKIKISTGNPTMQNQVIKKNVTQKRVFNDLSNIPEKELRRRESLKRIEAISKVRRLADKVLYEIEAPGVEMKQDVVITELASGIEIKVYTKDKCYVKFIPLKVEVIGYTLDKDRVLIELRS